MFSQDTIDFLVALRANNTRDWFEENRSTYHATVRNPAQEFAGTLSRLLEESRREPVAFKIFRINRDLRFSKDKKPYNAHVHIGFQPGGAEPDGPAWMVGLEPGKLSLGAGIMRFTPRQLEAWRESVAGPAGALLQQDLDHLLRRSFSMADPDLVRVPKPYPEDHSRGDLLRRKGMVVWWHSEATQMAYGPEGPARCQERLNAFSPIMIWLSETMHAV